MGDRRRRRDRHKRHKARAWREVAREFMEATLWARAEAGAAYGEVGRLLEPLRDGQVFVLRRRLIDLGRGPTGTFVVDEHEWSLQEYDLRGRFPREVGMPHVGLLRVERDLHRVGDPHVVAAHHFARLAADLGRAAFAAKPTGKL